MSPLVTRALRALTERVNLSSGLAHPSDEGAAKELFQRLHQAGEILLANEISTWARQNHWASNDANQLGALAQQIGMGKTVRIKDGPYWNDRILDTLPEDD